MATDEGNGEAGGKPARSQEWALDVGDRRSSLAFYRVVRGLVRVVLFRWMRVRSRGEEHLALEGPVIVAPVHRSNVDSVVLAGLTERRLRALGKESLFVNPVSAWVCAALGAIPLRRGEADREAMRSARGILDGGEMMIVFPEGTRQTGDRVTGVFDGMSYLASKTGATIVPVGIAGTEEAMPAGARIPHRGRVGVVVGEPIEAPKGRLSRPALSAFSAEVAERLQASFDESIELAAR